MELKMEVEADKKVAPGWRYSQYSKLFFSPPHEAALETCSQTIYSVSTGSQDLKDTVYAWPDLCEMGAGFIVSVTGSNYTIVKGYVEQDTLYHVVTSVESKCTIHAVITFHQPVSSNMSKEVRELFEGCKVGEELNRNVKNIYIWEKLDRYIMITSLEECLTIFRSLLTKSDNIQCVIKTVTLLEPKPASGSVLKVTGSMTEVKSKEWSKTAPSSTIKQEEYVFRKEEEILESQATKESNQNTNTQDEKLEKLLPAKEMTHHSARKQEESSECRSVQVSNSFSTDENCSSDNTVCRSGKSGVMDGMINTNNSSSTTIKDSCGFGGGTAAKSPRVKALVQSYEMCSKSTNIANYLVQGAKDCLNLPIGNQEQQQTSGRATYSTQDEQKLQSCPCTGQNDQENFEQGRKNPLQFEGKSTNMESEVKPIVTVGQTVKPAEEKDAAILKSKTEVKNTTTTHTGRPKTVETKTNRTQMLRVKATEEKLSRTQKLSSASTEEKITKKQKLISSATEEKMTEAQEPNSASTGEKMIKRQKPNSKAGDEKVTRAQTQDRDTMTGKEHGKLASNTESKSKPNKLPTLEPHTTKPYVSGVIQKCYGIKEARKSEKVLLLIGASGSGKTTLMNVAANYLKNESVTGERFEVVSSCDHSLRAAKSITAYTFCFREDDTPFTIIDTPGITSDVNKESEACVQTLKTLLSSSDITIHAVGLVVASRVAQLTTTERNLLQYCVMQFGESMADHIITFITFADSLQTSPVLETLRQSGVKSKLLLQFNISSLAETSDEIEKTYWKKGVKCFKKCFIHLESLMPLSVNTLTGLQNRAYSSNISEVTQKRLTDELTLLIKLLQDKNERISKKLEVCDRVWEVAAVVYRWQSMTGSVAENVEGTLVATAKKTAKELGMYSQDCIDFLSLATSRGLVNAGKEVLHSLAPVYETARIAKPVGRELPERINRYCLKCKDNHYLERKTFSGIMSYIKGFGPSKELIAYACTNHGCKCDISDHVSYPPQACSFSHDEIIKHAKKVLTALLREFCIPGMSMTVNMFLDYLNDIHENKFYDFIQALKHG